MHDSDDDLLESSEEEDDDDDLTENPKRMPEPGVCKSTQAKDPSTFGSSAKRSVLNGLSRNPIGSDGAADVGNGSGARTRTTGVPPVALQMQEMEGRPSLDDGPPITAESSNDARGHTRSASPESTGDSGNTENTIREYMVRVPYTPL